MSISTEPAPQAAAPDAPAAANKTPGHAQFIGSIPGIYDEHLGPLLFEFSAADLAKRVREVQPGADRVLEIACGTGILTDSLWQAYGPDTEVAKWFANYLDTRGYVPNARF